MRMRWVLLAAGLACFACTKPDPHADAAATLDKGATRTLFTKAAPVVGAKRQESSELTMTLVMTVDGGRSDVNIRESVKRTEEILAVNGEAITKERVTFDDVQSTGPTSIKGKTFVVEAKGSKIEVLEGTGDAREVERHLKNLGKPDPMLAALPSDGVAVGQRVEGVARAISDQLEESDMRVSDVVVTFKERRGDDGIFDVALKLTKDDGATKMSITVQGDVWVSTRTSSTTKMDLSGPVTIGGGRMTKTEGSGKMAMKMEAKSL
jgi:hypothetical protein